VSAEKEANLVISFLLAVTSSAISATIVKSKTIKNLLQCMGVEGYYGEGVKIEVACKTQCVPMNG
jgi:hypothetical protein